MKRCLQLFPIILAAALPGKAHSGVLEADVDSVNFGTVWVGNTGHEFLTVLNAGGKGGKMLELSNIDVVSTSSELWMASGPETCEAGQLIGECRVWLKYRPDSVGPVTGTLVVETADGQSLEIPIAGTSGIPPIPELSPSEFHFELAVGESASQTLTIHNAGEADLIWYIRSFFFCIMPSWMDFSESSGVIPAGAYNEIEVQVPANWPGTYEYVACFNWKSDLNTGGRNQREIPFTLVVTEPPLFSDRFEE